MSEPTIQPSQPSAPSEAESVLTVLERNRRTFAWKTADFDERGLRAITAASTMTLGGLVKHVALVAPDGLAVKLAGRVTPRYGRPSMRRRRAAAGQLRR